MLRFHHFVYCRDKYGQVHPVYDCYHLQHAHKERASLERENQDGSLFYVVTKIDALDLTRMESFVKLVYETRDLQKQYWPTKDHDVMVKAMALEARIDEWIQRWVDYCATHPGYIIPNERDRYLFETVRTWRITMQEWSRHKPKDDYKRKLKEECQGYEATIDAIINYRLENYREFR